MNNLLDNELVRKYFGCDDPCPHEHDCKNSMSRKILEAMQQPIKNQEKYLAVLTNIESHEISSVVLKTANDDIVGIHFGWLRLPDRFQKKEECLHPWFSTIEQQGIVRCKVCDEIIKPKPEPDDEPKDEVEGKISLMVRLRREYKDLYTPEEMETQLRELVELAKLKCRH